MNKEAIEAIMLSDISWRETNMYNLNICEILKSEKVQTSNYKINRYISTKDVSRT